MKRIISLLLALVLLIGMLPVSVQAATLDNGLEYKVYADHVEITGFYSVFPTDIVIPSVIEGKPVTSIADYAFFNSYRLTGVSIPASVTSIGEGAFSRCDTLYKIHVDENNPNYSSDEHGVLYDKDKTILIQTPTTISDAYLIPDSVTHIGDYAFDSTYRRASIVLPDGVTYIGNYAFYHCGNLSGIVFPEGVTHIGDYAFSYCFGLPSIILPDSVTHIGQNAFYQCEKATSLVLSDNLTYIGDYAFTFCSKLRNVVIPDSVTHIGDYAFCNCEWLTDIVIPGGVTYFGEAAFFHCDRLTSAVIEDGVTYIGDSAFSWSTNLTSIVIPDSVTTIGNGAFDACNSLTGVVIPDSVTSIGENAFAGCDKLPSIFISDNVTSIGEDAFHNCYSLTEILVDKHNPNYSSDDRGVLFDKEKTELIQAPGAITGSYVTPDSVTRIDDGAFYYCHELTGITIPDSVTYIGDSNFYYCHKLTDIVIPDSVTTIGDYVLGRCSSLTGIHVDENNPNYSSDDRGVLFDKEKTELIQAPGAITDPYEIPDSVTCIADYAFSGCSLVDVGIPDSVTYIGDHAFDDCSKLISIRFKGNAPELGSLVFCDVTANAYYPAENPTWTADVMHENYTSGITWIPYDPSHTHDFTLEVTAPTCTMQGYTIFTCDCGLRYVGAYTDALGHTYVDKVCIHCGDEIFTPFTDVSESDFYCMPVSWAVENGITTGTSEDSFSPNDQCLRAHVVTFLWRANGCPEPTTTDNSFTDVKESDFFYKAVLWAVEWGITNGTSDTTFGSYDVCNRAQVVTFLHRAMGSPVSFIPDPFTDVPDDAWYAEPVAWAVEYGITNGLTATEFGPDASCNRAQVVTFLYRAYN